MLGQPHVRSSIYGRQTVIPSLPPGKDGKELRRCVDFFQSAICTDRRTATDTQRSAASMRRAIDMGAVEEMAF